MSTNKSAIETMFRQASCRLVMAGSEMDRLQHQEIPLAVGEDSLPKEIIDQLEMAQAHLVDAKRHLREAQSLAADLFGFDVLDGMAT